MKRFALADPPDWLIPGLLALALIGMFLLPLLQRPMPMGLTFNSMMQHMLHGQFDVDPATIRREVYVRDGKSYSYFGVFCALLRLPLLAAGRPDVDMTVVSIGCATLLGLWARMRAAALAMQGGRGLSRLQRILMFAGFALSGEAIQFLKPSIYQEVVTWGAALASVFGLLVLRLCLGQAKSRLRLYLALATVSGLEFLCRPTFGIGAYLAMGAIFAIDLWRGRLVSRVGTIAPAALVLVLAAAAVAGVNEARWGNPATFAPLDRAAFMNRQFPDRPARLKRYGEFNIERAPFALEYYLVPTFALAQRSGPPPLTARQRALYDEVEFPPASLFLSDAFVIALAAIGLQALARRRGGLDDPRLGAAVLLALAVPIAMILSLLALTFRYRMEFYPALDLAALFGLRSLASTDKPVRAWAAAGLAGLTAAALCSSLFFCVLYRNAPFGPLQDFEFKGGWVKAIIDSPTTPVLFRRHVMPDGSEVYFDSLPQQAPAG